MALICSGCNKWLCLIGFLIVCLMTQNICAGEISTIELNDGSIISGEVVSFDGSTWVIQSANGTHTDQSDHPGGRKGIKIKKGLTRSQTLFCF